jgi:glycosyltransferase involved in cell wall biosynthesis
MTAAGKPDQRRVLLVLGTSTGGIGLHVRSLARGLVERGVRVVVAGPTETEQLHRFGEVGARFVTAPIQASLSPVTLAVARNLGRWVRGADVVHAHGFRAGAVGLAAGAGAGWPVAGVRRADVPMVVSWHNQVLVEGAKAAIVHRVERAVARGATLNLGASDDLVEQARRCGGRAELGPVAAPEPPSPVRDAAAVRNELGLDADQPLVLAVGRLHLQKDYPTMVQAMAQLSSRTPQAVLAIAGDGPDAAAIETQARGQGVLVQLLGRRADVADLMSAADLLVVASVWEARALVVQEAMQVGLPVVATAVGGVPDLVGDDALLVPAREPQALAAAIASVLDDPGAARQRANAARERSRSWPDEDEVVDRVLRVYDEVTARHSMSPSSD